MGLIEKYAYRVLHKKAAKINRRVKLPHPDNIRKVGILWHPLHYDAYMYLYDHFLQKQVIFRNLCIDIDNIKSNETSNVITSKELNWLGFPRQGSFNDFIEMEFDILLNIALEQNRVLDYFTALSKAKFKIGWSPHENNYFDLNININEKLDALYLAKQQIFYISQLNKKN